MARKLSDYIALELREVVPVDTGRLRGSIVTNSTGVLAEDYYRYVMEMELYNGLEDLAIERGLSAFIKDFENDLDI